MQPRPGMINRSFAFLFATLVPCAACSGGESGPAAEHPADAANGCVLGLCAPDPAAGIQLTIDATVQPGDDKRFCKYVVLQDAREYGAMEHRYTPVSHHLVAYPTLLTPDTIEAQTSVELDQVFECDSVVDRKQAGLLYAAQSPSARIEYPPGVAYPTGQGLVVLIEYHAINTTTRPVEAAARLNLEVAAGDIQNYAGMLFYYHPRILIKPRASATVTAHCEVPQDITLLYGLSHMHSRGVAQRSWLVGEGGALDTPLFDTKEWVEPQLKFYDPPMQINEGRFIGFSCDYVNPETRTIHEGQKTTDEMCMAPFGYFTPKSAPAMTFADRLCWSKGSGAVFSGTKTCKETTACIASVQARALPIFQKIVASGRTAITEDDWPADLLAAFYQCSVDTSPASSQAVDDLHGPAILGQGGCKAVKCGAAPTIDATGVLTPAGPCWNATGTPECDACLAQNCAAEVAACDAAG